MMNRLTIYLLVAVVFFVGKDPPFTLGQTSVGLSVVDPDQILAIVPDLPNDHSSTLDEDPSKPRFVLTVHGAVQEGAVTEGEKAVYVQLPGQKGGITISKIDVAFIGESRESLFEFRRSKIHWSNTSELIKLADWAVRNQLTFPAIIMMKEAMDRNTDTSAKEALSQKISQLEYVEKIRLDAMNRRQSEKLQPEKLSEAEQQLKEMEQWSQTVPMSVQDRYFKKIQPILVKRCSAKECHGDPNGVFVLHRFVAGVSHRTNSLKNLRSLLERVNLNNPSSSSLLTHPPMTDRLGNIGYPFGNDTQSFKDYELFVGWINSLSGLTAVSTHTSSSFGIPAERSYLTIEETSSFSAQAIPPLAILQTGMTQDGEKFLARERNSSEQVLKRGGIIPSIVPKDVYDPLLFNHRYYPERTIIPE